MQISKKVQYQNDTYCVLSHHNIAARTGQIFLLTGHGSNTGTTPTKAPEHNGIANHIKLLLYFALHILIEWQSVRAQRRTVQIIRLGTLDDAIDLFAGITDGLEDWLEITYLIVLPAGYFEVPLVGFELLLALSGWCCYGWRR